MKTNAERQADFRRNRVTLTLGEALELLQMIEDKGMDEFAGDNPEFSSVLDKLRSAHSTFMDSD